MLSRGELTGEQLQLALGVQKKLVRVGSANGYNNSVTRAM
jgi:hypothetical protein